MIFDIADLKNDKIPGVIIIGSGPAGVTLSKKLADSGVDNLILEAGNMQYSELAQDTCVGSVIGDEYWELKASHLKMFGGTSNHWTGVCRALDEADFQKRTDIPNHIGWPISELDLDPYRDEAKDILEVSYMRQAEIDDYLQEVEFSLSSPVRFGRKYLDYFSNSTKAHVCLNANVVSITAENGRAKYVTVAGPKKSNYSIETQFLVIGAGGIDNSRLLLWSNEVSSEPVVKNKDLLGKYWFEHPHNIAGEVFLVDHIQKFSFPQNWMWATFSPTPHSMEKYSILNACLRLRKYDEAHHTSWLKHLRWRAACMTKNISHTVSSSLADNVRCAYPIEMVWEQEPREGNKVTLSDSVKDAFGVPRPIIYWSKSKVDYRTPKVMMELFGRYLALNNLGYLRSYDHIIGEHYHPPSTWMAGHHHMGGTRMSDRASEGVVDRNLKIFGIDNAYVIGSSVFPNGGHANPTFTIVQLSLRLANYLSGISRNASDSGRIAANR